MRGAAGHELAQGRAAPDTDDDEVGVDLRGALGDRTGAAALVPRPAAVRGWNERLQQRMAATVWNTGGCQSWYMDANGRNTTLWPGTTAEYRRATHRLRPEEYELVPAVAPVTPEVTA